MSESTEIKFSAEAQQLVDKYIAKFPEGKQKSALISVLHLAQIEFGGWLSPQVMDYVASVLDITPIEVYEVATFYSMFYTKPKGKYVFEVCHTGPCNVCGAKDIIAYIENKLGIKKGETTPDGRFTLVGVECLAACGNAPVVQVGMDYYENVDESKIDEMVDKFTSEDKVSRVYL